MSPWPAAKIGAKLLLTGEENKGLAKEGEIKMSPFYGLCNPLSFAKMMIEKKLTA